MDSHAYLFFDLGCPVDTQDNSKRWCSTKVDKNRNHMVGQNQYGNCNQFCPRHIEKSQPLIQSIYLYSIDKYDFTSLDST